MRLRRIGKELLSWIPPAAAMVVLAACGADAPTAPEAQGWEVVPQQAATVVDAHGFFASVGCRPTTEKGFKGVILVRRQNGKGARFDCNGVDRDLLAERESSYAEAIAAATPGAKALYGYYSWEWTSTYTCTNQTARLRGYDEDGGYYEIANSSNEYIETLWLQGSWDVTYTVATTCEFVDTFRGTWHPGSANPNQEPPPPAGYPGGGGSNTPPPPPAAADTCPARDEKGIINQKSVQDTLRAAFLASQPFGGDEARNEIGGIIVRLGDGTLIVRRLPADPATSDNCRYEPLGGYNQAQAGETIEAVWHTHPYAYGGRTYFCRSSPTRRRTAVQNLTGGGSLDADWILSTVTGGRPVYTIDNMRIWRLDEALATEEQRRANSNYWIINGNGCATHADN